MIVKRYIVDSMPDALQKIRTDLGKDAVILNTKEIKQGGLLGLFGKKKIEVIAATDSPAGAAASASQQPSGGAAGSKPQRPAKPRQAAKPATPAAAPERPASEREPATATLERPVVAPAKAASAYGAARPAGGTASTATAVPAAAAVPAGVKPTGAAAPAAAIAAAPAAAAWSAREEQLFDEIRQMKEMMKKLSTNLSEPGLPEPFQLLVEQLERQEVYPELASRIVQSAYDRFIEQQQSGEAELSPEAAAESLVRRELMNLLQRQQGNGIKADTRVVHFVGPTGVGKTTTIAKLAAEQVLKLGRKVGFITSDTYRIAAVEQLRTYATILNVPLEVVFSPMELNRAFEALSDCDLIFMDTAGRNFRNEMYVSELNSLLKSHGNSETLLVLSLTTKYKDMKTITENFLKFQLSKVLFTKSDETDSCGAIVNIVHDYGLDLSYITYGQNVPDDIVEAGIERIISMLLEERGNE